MGNNLNVVVETGQYTNDIICYIQLNCLCCPENKGNIVTLNSIEYLEIKENEKKMLDRLTVKRASRQTGKLTDRQTGQMIMEYLDEYGFTISVT